MNLLFATELNLVLIQLLYSKIILSKMVLLILNVIQIYYFPTDNFLFSLYLFFFIFRIISNFRIVRSIWSWVKNIIKWSSVSLFSFDVLQASSFNFTNIFLAYTFHWFSWLESNSKKKKTKDFKSFNIRFYTSFLLVLNRVFNSNINILSATCSKLIQNYMRGFFDKSSKMQK